MIVTVLILAAAFAAQTIGFLGAYRQLGDDLRFERTVARKWRDIAYDLARKYDALQAGASPPPEGVQPGGDQT